MTARMSQSRTEVHTEDHQLCSNRHEKTNTRDRLQDVISRAWPGSHFFIGGVPAAVGQHDAAVGAKQATANAGANAAACSRRAHPCRPADGLAVRASDGASALRVCVLLDRSFCQERSGLWSLAQFNPQWSTCGSSWSGF